MQKKYATVDFSVAAHVHNHLARVEFPLGVRQFAGGDGAVIDQIMVGTGFVDNSSGKREGSGRSENYAIGAKAQPSGSNDIVELPGFERQVVSGVRSANVVVIGAAVEREVSGCGRLPRVGVVSGLIRPHHIASVIDFNRPVQLVNRAFLLLLDGADGVDVFSLFLLRRSRRGARG